MSKEQEPLEDYTTYSGSYQAGQLLHEEGEIDLDELNKGDTGKTPILIKVLFGIFIGLLSSGGYFVFVYLKAKKLEEKIDLPPRDEFLGKMIKKHSKIKEMYQVSLDCSFSLTQALQETKSETSLRQDCPAWKVGKTDSYQLSCEDKQDCKKQYLEHCKAGTCNKVEGITYRDFTYAKSLRLANGIDAFYAYQRLFNQAQSKMYKLEKAKSKDEKAQLKAQIASAKLYRKKLESLLKGEGFDKNSFDTPFVSITETATASQIIAYAKSLSTSPKDTGKKKRRQKKSKRVSVLRGGELKSLKSFPMKAYKISSFIEASVESKAAIFARNKITKYNFTPLALNFWGNTLIRKNLLKCAEKGKGTFAATVTFNGKTGLAQSVQFTEGQDGDLKTCTEKALNKLFLPWPKENTDPVTTSYKIVLQ